MAKRKGKQGKRRRLGNTPNPRAKEKMMENLLEIKRRWGEIPSFNRFGAKTIQLDPHKKIFFDGVNIVKQKGAQRRGRTKKTELKHWNYKAINNAEAERINQTLNDYIIVLRYRDKTIKPQEIADRCKNQTILSWIIRDYGEKEFFQELKATVIHTNGKSRLLEVNLRTGALVMVEVVDPSTHTKYLLRVPPNIHTCQEAIAWTFGMRAEDYKPIKET